MCIIQVLFVSMTVMPRPLLKKTKFSISKHLSWIPNRACFKCDVTLRGCMIDGGYSVARGGIILQRVYVPICVMGTWLTCRA